MKKLLFLMLSVVALFAIAGCEKKEEPKAPKIKEVEYITVNDTINITEGESRRLSPHIYPQDLAIYTKLFWSTSNDNIATVSSNGTVTALKKGACLIIVSTADGKHKDTCLVTVNEKKKEIIPPTIKVSNLYCDDTPVELGADNTIYNVEAGQKISGYVSFYSYYGIYKIEYAYSDNTSGWIVFPDGWWTDYVVSSYDDHNRTLGYFNFKDGCKNAGFSFSFNARAYKSFKIAFFLYDWDGNKATFEITIVEK